MLTLRLKLDSDTFERLAFAAVRSKTPMPCLAESIIRDHFGGSSADTEGAADRPPALPQETGQGLPALSAA